MARSMRWGREKETETNKKQKKMTTETCGKLLRLYTRGSMLLQFFPFFGSRQSVSYKV